jgi:carbon-monoxide dehydrogenase small subunit
MLMAATHLLAKIPSPNIAEIREGLAGNLCRCTGFIRIFDSVVASIADSSSTSVRQAGNAR